MSSFLLVLRLGLVNPEGYTAFSLFPHLSAIALRRLKLLEEENRKLKQLVADLSLDKLMLQDVLAKKL